MSMGTLPEGTGHTLFPKLLGPHGTSLVELLGSAAPHVDMPCITFNATNIESPPPPCAEVMFWVWEGPHGE